MDPEGSGEVSKIISSCGTQGGRGKRTSSKHIRTRGKRLLKGDIIGRYVQYERRKLFLKGDGGVKVWLAVGNDGRMRVPASWKMVRVGAEKGGDGEEVVEREEVSTAVPETNLVIDEVESELRRVLMGDCGGFIDSQVAGGRMQGLS